MQDVCVEATSIGIEASCHCIKCADINAALVKLQSNNQAVAIAALFHLLVEESSS